MLFLLWGLSCSLVNSHYLSDLARINLPQGNLLGPPDQVKFLITCSRDTVYSLILVLISYYSCDYLSVSPIIHKGKNMAGVPFRFIHPCLIHVCFFITDLGTDNDWYMYITNTYLFTHCFGLVWEDCFSLYFWLLRCF